jgi:hypothetical protein
MEPTPSYFQISKKTKIADTFRNCWCPHYDLCLSQAARKDVLLDCKACLFKDMVVDDFSCWLTGKG